MKSRNPLNLLQKFTGYKTTIQNRQRQREIKIIKELSMGATLPWNYPLIATGYLQQTSCYDITRDKIAHVDCKQPWIRLSIAIGNVLFS